MYFTVLLPAIRTPYVFGSSLASGCLQLKLILAEKELGNARPWYAVVVVLRAKILTIRSHVKFQTRFQCNSKMTQTSLTGGQITLGMIVYFEKSPYAIEAV